MNQETEGKINLLLTFIQWFVAQNKLSLNFTETLLFPQKTQYFLNNSHNAYKNSDGNSKCHITKLNPWKLTFWKQPIKREDEINVSVILANKYKVKAKNFIISIFYFPVLFLRELVCCNTSTISFFLFTFLLVSFSRQ